MSGGRQLDAHVAAFGRVLGDAVGGGELAIEHRRHEGHRVVGLQVGGLVGQDGVGDAVALVETVAGEGLDLVPQIRGLGARHAAAGGAVDELLLHLGHDVGLLLAHGLAQHVRLGHAEAGHLHGDQHHLLLVDDDAVGLLQDRLHLGSGIGEPLALLALDVLVDHADQGARPVERVQGGELVETRGLDPPQQVRHTPRFELEDAARCVPRRRCGRSRDRRAAARRDRDRFPGGAGSSPRRRAR